VKIDGKLKFRAAVKMPVACLLRAMETATISVMITYFMLLKKCSAFLVLKLN